jgi:hypothetical protein
LDRTKSRNGKSRWKVFDPIVGRFFVPLQVLSSVGGKTFDEPPLAFGEKRIKGERSFATPADAANADPLSKGDVQ